MTIRNFIKRMDFDDMKEKVGGKEAFSFESKVPVGGKIVKLVIDGRVIDKDLAESVWNGCNYLIGFDLAISGKGEYWGVGFCTTEWGIFKDWTTFKEWIDKNMSRVGGYETEEYGQMELF